jgi:NADP-reducing hydrogenase subunit HndD
MEDITIKINGQECKCKEGDSVLAVALESKIEVPHFCYHEDLPIDGACRICLVEHDGKVVTSCSLKAEQGMEVSSESEEVKKYRKINLELLLSNHQELCKNCQRGYACSARAIMETYGAKPKRYNKPPTHCPQHKLGTAAELDPELCIGCNKCVEMCQKIGVGYLRLVENGAHTHVAPVEDKKIDCIYCGQCTVHCPVGAAREQTHLEEVIAAIEDPEKIVIAQMAPSIRCSIGEEFGADPGAELTGECYSALRELGFDKIFDVNFGADITTWVEAEELVHRIKNNGVLPMFTSCCPGWVKCAEFYYPNMLRHMTTSRSPQIHAGVAYKTWWAHKHGVDPHKIVVVSFMPCTSKKYEAGMSKFDVHGMKPVDHVLTTREFGNWMKSKQIELLKLEKSEPDELGAYSGAAAIYGASGGVMESALRTAAYLLEGKDLERLEFESVRGMEGIKKAEVELGGKKLRVAVVATKTNIDLVMEELKKDKEAYHYIEVMACPGGCIGGGGQPIPSTNRIIKKRIAGLYGIDDKSTIRLAHKNPLVQDFMNHYIAALPKEERSALLHTQYRKRERGE